MLRDEAHETHAGEAGVRNHQLQVVRVRVPPRTAPTVPSGTRPAEIDSPLTELPDSRCRRLPLPPHHAAQVPSQPLVQPLEARLRLRQPKVRYPPPQHGGELLNRADQVAPARSP
jgi:hypothetical protein